MYIYVPVNIDFYTVIVYLLVMCTTLVLENTLKKNLETFRKRVIVYKEIIVT